MTRTALCLTWLAALLFAVSVLQAEGAKFNVVSIGQCMPKTGTSFSKCKTMIKQCKSKFNIDMKWVGTNPCGKKTPGGCQCANSCNYLTRCGVVGCTNTPGCQWADDRCAPISPIPPGSKGECGVRTNSPSQAPTSTPPAVYAYATANAYQGKSFQDALADCKANAPSQCADTSKSCVGMYSAGYFGGLHFNKPYFWWLHGQRGDSDAVCDMPPLDMVSASTGTLIREGGRGYKAFKNSFYDAGVLNNNENVWFGSYPSILEDTLTRSCSNLAAWPWHSSSSISRGTVGSANALSWLGINLASPAPRCNTSHRFVCICAANAPLATEDDEHEQE